MRGSSKKKKYPKLVNEAYVPIQRKFLRGEKYMRLSAHAVKLFFDLISQYTLENNGDFCVAWKIMKKKGWKSRGTLERARKELLENNLIIISRQGGKNKCSLYAVTIWPLHYCKGKLDAHLKPTKEEPIGGWEDAIPKIKIT